MYDGLLDDLFSQSSDGREFGSQTLLRNTFPKMFYP